MSNLGTFLFEQRKPVRLLDWDGQVWFVLNDVCQALDLTNPRRAAQRLDDDEKGVTIGDTLGGQQLLSVVNEAGLYSLILTSRKAEARRFKRWITHEVLPELRRTGQYGLQQRELLERVIPFLHDHQLRVLHALEAVADDTSLVAVGRLPMITGLSIGKIRRTLQLFEVLGVIWWVTSDLVRLRRRERLWADWSTPPSALVPRSPWRATVR
jgi:prophage antirepressor-like protein